MNVGGLPGTQHEGCPGGGVGRNHAAPLGLLPELGLSGRTLSGEGKGRAGWLQPLTCDCSPHFLGAHGSTKSGHHLSFLAVAVMQTAPAQLPIQVTGSHTPPFPDSQGAGCSAPLFLTAVH